MDWLRDKFAPITKKSLERYQLLHSVNSADMPHWNAVGGLVKENDASEMVAGCRMFRRGGVCGNNLRADLKKLKHAYISEIMKDLF